MIRFCELLRLPRYQSRRDKAVCYDDAIRHGVSGKAIGLSSSVPAYNYRDALETWARRILRMAPF